MSAQSPEVGPTTSALTSPAVNTIAAQAGASVRPTSIVSEFDPAKSLATQLLDYECYGATKNVNTIPTAGIGAAIAENATNPGLRLGFERAPNSQRSSYVFRVAHNDPTTQGGYRCELAFTKSPRGDLPKGTTFWYVTNLWIDDWTKAKDDQLVTQFHDRDFSLGLSPYFAFYIKGEQARVTVRWEASNGPTTATSARVTKDIWTGPFNFSRRWVTLVVKTLVSTKTTDNPFISVWLDGKHLATYRGPLGYNQPTLKDYAKVGYYHWTTNNPWDSAIPVRTMYVGNTAVISDPANEYTEPLIREYSWASQ